MWLVPTDAQLADFFTESGEIVKNTLCYIIEKHDYKLYPIFFERSEEYHANQVNRSI